MTQDIQDTKDQSPNTGIIHESQIPPGTIKPRHLAADSTMRTGDMYIVNASGIFQRIALSTNNQFLTVVSGVPAWVTFPRTGTVESSAIPSINTDNIDMFTITELAVAITSMTTNLSGTPREGQKLIIRILDNGTARAITWGASFASRGATLPTTTTLSKYTYVGLIYNSVAVKWDCVAAVTEA